MSALYLYLLPKDKECCANEDSDLYNVKNYFIIIIIIKAISKTIFKTMVRRFRVITMIINDFHIFGRNTNAFSFAFPLFN